MRINHSSQLTDKLLEPCPSSQSVINKARYAHQFLDYTILGKTISSLYLLFTKTISEQGEHVSQLAQDTPSPQSFPRVIMNSILFHSLKSARVYAIYHMATYRQATFDSKSFPAAVTNPHKIEAAVDMARECLRATGSLMGTSIG